MPSAHQKTTADAVTCLRGKQTGGPVHQSHPPTPLTLKRFANPSENMNWCLFCLSLHFFIFLFAFLLQKKLWLFIYIIMSYHRAHRKQIRIMLISLSCLLPSLPSQNSRWTLWQWRPRLPNSKVKVELFNPFCGGLATNVFRRNFSVSKSFHSCRCVLFQIYSSCGGHVLFLHDSFKLFFWKIKIMLVKKISLGKRKQKELCHCFWSNKFVCLLWSLFSQRT